MKHFVTDEQRAILYATFKELERMLKDDGDISPNSKFEVGGQTVSLTLPDGMTVSRSGGENGDGIEMNSAMQNTYGYAVLYLFIERLTKFKQANALLNELKDVIVEVTQNRAASTETVLKERNPELYQQFDNWKEQLRSELGERQQATPRKIHRDNNKLFPTIRINLPSKDAA